MSEHTWKCPSCGAALRPSRFARDTVCEHCGNLVQIDEAAVSTARFREAYEAWNAASFPDGTEFEIGGGTWRRGDPVAHGEIADVYRVRRVRWPPQRALLKVLRDAADRPMLDAETHALERLRTSKARGAEAISPLVPLPLCRGTVRGGPNNGMPATLLVDPSGFDHDLEAVRAAYPRGVGGHVGVWIWRRLLEVLAFAHASGVVHGAVIPPHVLVERGEHGVRLVGYGCAGEAGAPLSAVVLRHESMYPKQMLASHRLSPAHDVSMSARCVGYALGADPEGRIPGHVPEPIGALLAAVASGEESGDAWAIRERVGKASSEVYGAPSFHPLVMPADSIR